MRNDHTPTVQHYLRHDTARQRCHAWWDGKKDADGTYHIHFHADFVPSANWTAPDYGAVMLAIINQSKSYQLAMDARFGKAEG